MSVLWAAVVLAAGPARGVDGGLSMDLVRDVIEWHAAEVNACFSGGSKRPSVRYRFEVAPGGKVVRLALLDAQRADGPRITCLGTALEKWRFPAADGGAVVEWDFSTSSVDAGVPGTPIVFAPDEFPAAWVDDAARCYDATLPPRVREGRLSLDLVVTRAGAVVEANATTVSPALAETELPACIAEVARTWSSAPSSAPRRVLTEWLFATSERRAKSMFLPTAPAREVIAQQDRSTPARGDGLERSVIYAAIQKENPRVRSCYEMGLQANGELEGSLRVEFQIGPDGRVLSSAVQEDTLGHQKTIDCILEVVRKLRFPPPQGGGLVNVTFPWIFKTAGE